MAEIGGKTAENCGNWWFSKSAETLADKAVYRKRTKNNCRKCKKPPLAETNPKMPVGNTYSVARNHKKAP
ncbi:hypothetical protein CJD36_017575 [Flavipsychrobacter stenotrophus]|uniref:Uncharacterized protein n=1 Tax=Flavipsychrobacter stenotrophus TaxID=2077091 RepID=A0A2S7SS43_9BACT|nr:hypothetical protein CJD36_017575 [Flavipsychrobacter stenotrophus]